MSFGWQEWLILGVVVLVIFGGAKKLPGLARSLGKSFREFKKAVKDVKDVKDDVKDDVSVDLDEDIDITDSEDNEQPKTDDEKIEQGS